MNQCSKVNKFCDQFEFKSRSHLKMEEKKIKDKWLHTKGNSLQKMNFGKNPVKKSEIVT